MGGSMREVLRALLLLYAAATNVLSLEITRLSIPSFVKNGSEESVLLDCEYTYSLVEDKKLVVKWFHEDDPNPVYQWIPELDSKLYSDKFRLDENYVMPSGNDYTRSRAISILKPTTELSGTYKCEVQSLEGSDNREDDMIVYAIPTFQNMNYTIRNGVVKVFCEVEGVYPLPEMSMFQVKPGSVDRIPINDTDMEYELEDGAYDLEFFTEIPEDELPSPSDGITYFGCSIVLKGTEYGEDGTDEISIPYFPNPIAEKQEGDDSDNGSSNHIAFTSLVILSSALQFLLT